MGEPKTSLFGYHWPEKPNHALAEPAERDNLGLVSGWKIRAINYLIVLGSQRTLRR